MILQDETEYQLALRLIEKLMDNEPAPRTPESDVFEILVKAVEHYEDKHYPMGSDLSSLMVSEGCPNDEV